MHKKYKLIKRKWVRIPHIMHVRWKNADKKMRCLCAAGRNAAFLSVASDIALRNICCRNALYWAAAALIHRLNYHNKVFKHLAALLLGDLREYQAEVLVNGAV